MSKPKRASTSSGAAYRAFAGTSEAWSRLEGVSGLCFSQPLRRQVKETVDQYLGNVALLNDATARARLASRQKNAGDLSLITFNNQMAAVNRTWHKLNASDTGFRLLEEFCNECRPRHMQLKEALEVMELAAMLMPGFIARIEEEVTARSKSVSDETEACRVQLISGLAEAFSAAGGKVRATGGGLYRAAKTSRPKLSTFVAFVRQVIEFSEAPFIASSGTDDAWSDSVNKLLSQWRRAQRR